MSTKGKKREDKKNRWEKQEADVYREINPNV